ncbi:tectonic-like complex member MKS1 [Bacillus rossius redtenbacheri]|uniref:tectonic-like complex member MKS1 n=1 Tax=Bacillus rossius redtenbacheri TaxID=93214 RepID=UPI002FDE800F
MKKKKKILAKVCFVNVKVVSMHNKSSNFVSGIYRSKDLIKNLKIRVRLEKEKLSLVAVHREASDEDGRVGVEEREFSWQEKVFSPSEVSYYKFAGNCHSPLEEKYHEDVARLWEAGMPTNRLFTYTDVDKYTGDEEMHGRVVAHARPSSSPDDALKQSAVRGRRRQGRELHQRHNILDYFPSDDALRRNHTLQNACQTFRILADLSSADITEEVDWVGRSEYVLCTIRWDSVNGVLQVTPDFSPDPYLVEVDEDCRSLYSYWVTHASSDISQEERDCERELMDKLTEHHLSIRQLQIGSDFDVPDDGVLTVFVMGEIMCAENFEADQLFIHFLVELPKGWSCDDPEHLSGITQACQTDRADVANFGHTFQMKLNHSLDRLQIEPDALPGGPQVFLEVVSRDGWGRCRSEGYGSARLPAAPGRHELSTPTWRPRPAGVGPRLRRFFLGGAPELLSLAHSGVPCDPQGPVVSKYGLPTVTSGSVLLRLDIVHQSRALAGEGAGPREKDVVALAERPSAATLVGSVNGALLAFRRARERMLQARDAAQAT